jgi:iron complex outermembrane receptor protein
MFDADFYRVKFQNAYTSATDTTTGATLYFLNPDSITLGGELETNVYLAHGLSVYANGSIGQATYTGTGVPSGLWVANTPKYTEGTGLTYQQKNLDLGIFQKAVGPMWQDNKSFHNQILVQPWSLANLFLNYNVRSNSIFDGTKIGVSLNNLFNSYDIVGVTPGSAAVAEVVNGTKSTYLATTTPGGSDLLSLTPGRSVMVSITFGLQRKR